MAPRVARPEPRLLGELIILGCIFALDRGNAAQALGAGGLDWLMMHIPIISNVYDLSKRFVAIVDRGGEDNLKSMRPVWCFFGGEGGAAVLGLMPSREPVMVGEHKYIAVLVPSAPVPFGGALIYVPADWIKPADGGDWIVAAVLHQVDRELTDPRRLRIERNQQRADLQCVLVDAIIGPRVAEL